MRDATTASFAGSTSTLRSASSKTLVSALAALGLVAVLTLMFASPASADKGIVGSFGGTGTTGGLLGSRAQGMGINVTGAGGVAPGTVYVDDVGNRRIDVFKANGEFIETWGLNVLGVNEEQRVIVAAAGGTYTLTANGQTTKSLAFNATGASVAAALAELPSIGAGNVTGSNTGTEPPITNVVKFTGTLSGTDVSQITANGAGLEGTNPVTGGAPTITTETTITGAGGNFLGYEKCTQAQASICAAAPTPTAPVPLGGFSGGSGLAVDQADGSVYVADRTLLRVTKFTATGTPLFVVGKDVNSTQAGTTTEVCPRSGFPADVCKTGTSGAAGGEFGSTIETGFGIAPVPAGRPNAGNIITTNPGNRRIEEFTSAGAFVQAIGWDVAPKAAGTNISRNEVQKITIPATSGTFTLKFTNPSGTSSTTGAIPYNATAAQVQTALNGLSSISSGGGSVTVSSGEGNATGSNPYVVEFTGGPLADAFVSQIETNGRNLGAAPGKTLTCVGTTALTSNYQWLRNGVAIPGATESTYVVTAADAGAAVQCQVFSFNANEGGGSTQASVPYVSATPIPGTARPTPPAEIPELGHISLPGQSWGVGEDGGYTLVCNTGSWGGSPSFTYQWYRSGVPLSGHGANTDKYVVQSEDLKTRAFFQCAVTGTNAGGGVTLMTRQNSSIAEWYNTSPRPEPSPPSAVPSATVLKDLPEVQITTPGSALESCNVASQCRAATAGTEPGQFCGVTSCTTQNPSRIAIDSAGDLYLVESTLQLRVQKFTPQGPSPGYSASIFAPPVLSPPGTDNSSQPVDVAIGSGDKVFVAKGFLAGATPECPDGTVSKTERRVLELSSDGNTLESADAVCGGITITSSVKALAVNPISGDIYLFAETEGNRIFIIGGTSSPPAVTLDNPVQTSTNALLTGTVNPAPTPSSYPNPPKTSWQLQYKLSSASTWTKFRTPTDVGSAAGNVPYRTTLTPLLPNTSYDVRVVANKQFNSSQAISSVKTFTTDKARPTILSSRSRHVSVSGADLEASIDPRGTDTDYFFEWGTTPNYGNVTPVTGIGGGQGGQFVSDHITGLSDVTYHFRVVAENDAGTVVGPDQSFSFHPPQCPNSLVRQQTGSGYLPDCRAFELVSHSDAGNSVIDSFTGPHSPFATSPSRLSYLALFAPLPENGNPPNNFDLYVSTRTTGGWISKHIGPEATEGFAFGGPPGPTGNAGSLFKNVQVDPRMDKMLLWDLGNYEISPPSFSNAPYLFDMDGEVIDRWPTNLDTIANGEDFGAQVYQLLASGDLTHFYFSSDIPFLPGASPTAIYDNDIAAGTLQIASKDPGGADFVGYPLEASTDGSHLLMSTATVPNCVKVPCAEIPAAHLYMRAGGSHTFDVTGGHNGRYAGMSADGSRVFFTSTEKISPGEADTSTDLYMWSEATDSITRVSAGAGGTGDSDACNAVSGWTAKCNIKLIRTYELKCGGSGIPNNCGPENPKPTFYNGDFNFRFAAANGHPGDDNSVAAAGEEIYFYSPEKLDGATKGAEGLPNLYVLHDGHAQFVATMNPEPACREDGGTLTNGKYCAAGPIGRIQVTPDGGYAAFTTADKLTGYDSKGFEEMYRYSPGDDNLVCVSCLPDGSAPKASVDGSQNGLFLAEDGRTFFTTSDPLQPDDTNETQDVYEYVDGGPQLITGGTGATREPLCSQCGLGQFSRPGLIGISADGLDVYFGTNDVLTPQDHNGGNLKIYDARTGGGFVNAAIPQPCQAADECHAPASTTPADPLEATGTNLGSNGNFSPNAEKRKAQKKHKRQKRRKKQRAHERKSRADHQRNTGRKHG